MLSHAWNFNVPGPESVVILIPRNTVDTVKGDDFQYLIESSSKQSKFPVKESFLQPLPKVKAFWDLMNSFSFFSFF